MDETVVGPQEHGFRAFFDEAEKRVEFWEENAIIGFTEDVCLAMERAGISRVELARRLGTSQAYVTKVLRGNANFTLRTMVRLAAALDSELRVHLETGKTRTDWLDRRRSRSRHTASPSPPRCPHAAAAARGAGSVPGRSPSRP